MYHLIRPKRPARTKKKRVYDSDRGARFPRAVSRFVYRLRIYTHICMQARTHSRTHTKSINSDIGAARSSIQHTCVRLCVIVVGVVGHDLRFAPSLTHLIAVFVVVVFGCSESPSLNAIHMHTLRHT